MSQLSYVEVMLVRSTGITSRAIEWFGAGHWSHFANLLTDWDDPKAEVLDARYDEVGGQQPGVRIRPVSYLKGTERTVLRIPCTPEQRVAWLKAGHGQIGKPYDSRGIWEFLTGDNARRDWRDPSAWFCSEYGIWMLEQAGICPPLPLHVNHITPGAAGLVCGALGGAVIARLKP
jgi:hypothetical protein